MRSVFALLAAAVLAAWLGHVAASVWGTFEDDLYIVWGGYAAAALLAVAGVAVWHVRWSREA